MKNKPKGLVLLSGGLDSRLVVEILKEQNLDIIAVFFDLPFGAGCCSVRCSLNYAQISGVPLKVIDCKKGKNLQEYIKIIRKPKHGYGTALNPCIDCRIFMLKKAKKMMKKLKADFIVTGEVLNERPMSQTRKNLMLVEKESGLEGKILRPLSARLLEETDAEKKSLVNRDKLMDISGRSRKIQISLAKKYKINYPTPAGGCLLCEKAFATKLKDLLKHKKKINKRNIELLKVGRHFRYKDNKIIVGRNEQENKKLLKLKGKCLIFEVKNFPSPITLLEGKATKKAIETAATLTAAHSDAKHQKKVTVGYGKGKFNKSLEVGPLIQEQVNELRLG